MLNFASSRRIFLARQATDMRKGCASLAAEIENALGHDLYTGDIYVFVGKHRNRVKIVAWDRSGFWISGKRLEQGTFSVPVGAAVADGTGTLPLSPAQIQLTPWRARSAGASRSKPRTPRCAPRSTQVGHRQPPISSSRMPASPHASPT